MVMFWVMGFVALIALIVIGGLFYFMKKESQKAAQGEAVPIMDISEIKGLSPSPSRSGEKVFSSDSIREIRKDDSNDELTKAKSKLAELDEKVSSSQAPHSSVSSSPDRDSAENASKLRPESSLIDFSSGSPVQDRISELESQLALVTQKSIEQAEEAVKVIEALMKENAQLKMNQSATPPGGAQDAAVFIDLKERNALLENQLDLSNSKVTQLEGQVALIKKELGQQLIEANAIIARLKAESEAHERVTQDSLFKQKAHFDEMYQSSSRKVRELEDDFIKTKEENLLLKDARKLLEAKLAVIEDDHKQEHAQAKELVNHLTLQNQAKNEQISQLEKDVAKIKELNDTLIDKAKILQYELNRYRAQASGLEKVCANFKSQMEEMFGQVEQTKRENNRLIQDRINLESGVASLKSENVRLIERDKVYQQELDKAKEQMNRLERIYKNFKTDVSGGSNGSQ